MLIFDVSKLKIAPKNYYFNSTFYMSTISFCSNEPSNFSNFSSKPKFFWRINSTKLKGNIHPTLTWPNFYSQKSKSLGFLVVNDVSLGVLKKTFFVFQFATLQCLRFGLPKNQL